MPPHPFTVITLALLGFSSGAKAQKKPFKPKKRQNSGLSFDMTLKYCSSNHTNKQ
jgi:hypothetical protein